MGGRDSVQMADRSTGRGSPPGEEHRPLACLLLDLRASRIRGRDGRVHGPSLVDGVQLRRPATVAPLPCAQLRPESRESLPGRRLPRLPPMRGRSVREPDPEQACPAGEKGAAYPRGAWRAARPRTRIPAEAQGDAPCDLREPPARGEERRICLSDRCADRARPGAVARGGSESAVLRALNDFGRAASVGPGGAFPASEPARPYENATGYSEAMPVKFHQRRGSSGRPVHPPPRPDSAESPR